jgi:hypothetical protein
VRKTSLMATHLVSTGVSTLKTGLMSVENVGNPLRQKRTLLYTREFTLEKGLMSVEIVGNPLRK